MNFKQALINQLRKRANKLKDLFSEELDLFGKQKDLEIKIWYESITSTDIDWKKSKAANINILKDYINNKFSEETNAFINEVGKIKSNLISFDTEKIIKSNIEDYLYELNSGLEKIKYYGIVYKIKVIYNNEQSILYFYKLYEKIHSSQTLENCVAKIVNYLMSN